MLNSQQTNTNLIHLSTSTKEYEIQGLIKTLGKSTGLSYIPQFRFCNVLPNSEKDRGA